jgi:hypothetical protein
VWVTAEPGKTEGLDAACLAVAELMDVTANRVTLRVEIPQELHFTVIGKKGENTKSIMGSTGCHVHFPETARPAPAGGAALATTAAGAPASHAKNQVTITGTPEGAELARKDLRGLLPLTVSFPVPTHIASGETVSMTPAIRAIADEFGVVIFFKQRADRGPLALVKAPRHEVRAFFLLSFVCVCLPIGDLALVFCAETLFIFSNALTHEAPINSQAKCLRRPNVLLPRGPRGLSLWSTRFRWTFPPGFTGQSWPKMVPY